jgi:hypothetical protein
VTDPLMDLPFMDCGLKTCKVSGWRTIWLERSTSGS